ncbi:MAG TPA: hypothetical protein VEA15_04130 [Caulobacteraceae bacterium]|nr:hypothetical protein [Caulobacteraceae bacterium]
MKRTVPGRKDKTTGTGLGRNSTFGRKTPASSKDEPRKGSSFSSSKAKPQPTERERVKKAAISALKKARRIAARTGVELSEWEDEFLGSVAERIKTYGRAFGDADKGDLAAPMSVMQGRKLREITRKAKGEKSAGPRFRRRGKAAEE